MPGALRRAQYGYLLASHILLLCAAGCTPTRRRPRLIPLSRVYQRILALLDFPVDICTRLCVASRQPP
jgi:hypothetical protein